MLIGGPSGVFICIECVDLCRQVFQEKGLLEAGGALRMSDRMYKDKRGATTGGTATDTVRGSISSPTAALKAAAPEAPMEATEPARLRPHLPWSGPRTDTRTFRHMLYSLMIENRTLRRRVNELEEAVAQEQNR